MANVAKGYGVGDTVWVWRYDNPTLSLMVTPISKVVQRVEVTTSGNVATVYFTDGTTIIDGSTARVFTTQAACATAIINAVISATAATVVLEGGAPTTLERND